MAVWARAAFGCDCVCAVRVRVAVTFEWMEGSETGSADLVEAAARALQRRVLGLDPPPTIAIDDGDCI